jgi:hypothetical protein
VGDPGFLQRQKRDFAVEWSDRFTGQERPAAEKQWKHCINRGMHLSGRRRKRFAALKGSDNNIRTEQRIGWSGGGIGQ